MHTSELDPVNSKKSNWSDDKRPSGKLTIPTTVVDPISSETFTVVSIDEGAFLYCTEITSVTIPEGVRTINYEAFKHCRSLEFINIPSTVTSLGDYALNACRNLANINCAVANPDDIKIDVFTFFSMGSQLDETTNIYVPVGSKEQFENASGWFSYNIIEGVFITINPTNKTNIQITTANGKVALQNLPQGMDLQIYTLTGQLVHQASAVSANMQIALPQGIYIVRIGQYADKVIVK